MVYGGQKYAVRAQLDPKALISRGIASTKWPTPCSAAMSTCHRVLYGPTEALTIQASGQLYSAKEYEPLVVAYRNGAPVRLSDLGQLFDSVENNKVAAWYKQTRAVVLAVQRQPGTNTIEVVNRIKQLLPTFREQLPESVDINLLFDRTVPIQESVADVKFTMMLTICLVVLVIFLFLRNASATIIPRWRCPLHRRHLRRHVPARLFGQQHLLLALTLAVGFVVDDAIVMLENIVRHIERGEGVREAASRGRKRSASPSCR